MTAFGTAWRWYISNTDPASNPLNRVRAGKPWIKTQLDAIPWGNILGVYLRNGDNTAWEPFSFGAASGGVAIPGLDGRDGDDSFVPGPPGIQGPAGAAGTAGADGVIGRDGIGVPGRDGDDGEQGWPGQAGISITGATGPAGVDGTPGLRGFDGQDGDDGWQGPPGPKGDPGSAMASYSGVRVTNSSTQSISNNTETAVTFDSEDYDTDGYHSTGSNTSRLVAPITGKYRIYANVAFNTNIQFENRLRLNGSTYIAYGDPAATAATWITAQTLETTYQLNAGDYVEVTVKQLSGGSVSTFQGIGLPHFGMDLLVGAKGDTGTQGPMGMRGDDGDDAVQIAAPPVSPGAPVLLFDQTLAADTASFDVTGIPPSYNELEIVLLGRTDEAVVQSTAGARFNGDSGANYSFTYVGWDAGGANSGNASAQTNISLGISGTSMSANYPAQWRLRIPGYAQTTFYKGILVAGGRSGATAVQNVVYDYTGSWANTAAINRVQVVVTSGSSQKFKAGSRLTIYGR